MRISTLHRFVVRVLCAVIVVLVAPAYTYGYAQNAYYGEAPYYGQSPYYGESPYYGYGYGYGQGPYNFVLSNSATVTGTVNVGGTLSKGSGTFAIDHPLDPKNKLLYHSFVESPDAMNIYDGIVVLDEHGSAEIELPNYFLALNTEYRYLGTAIGEPMPNLFLERAVRKRYFFLGTPVLKISGGVSGGKVSWQVTGVRKDPYIVAHPIVTEVKKSPDRVVDQGEYILPEYYEK